MAYLISDIITILDRIVDICWWVIVGLIPAIIVSCFIKKFFLWVVISGTIIAITVIWLFW